MAIGAFSLALVAWSFLNMGMCELPNRHTGQIEVQQLGQMVHAYYLSSSPQRLPDSLEDLTKGPSPLTQKVPTDPWGNEYIYIRGDELDFEILSGGADGFISVDRDD